MIFPLCEFKIHNMLLSEEIVIFPDSNIDLLYNILNITITQVRYGNTVVYHTESKPNWLEVFDQESIHW